MGENNLNKIISTYAATNKSNPIMSKNQFLVNCYKYSE